MGADPDLPDLGRRFFAYILIAAGSLVTLLSGACTLTWLGFIAFSLAKSPASAPSGVVPALFLALPFGGFPIAAGLAMIAGGRSLLKKPTPRLDLL